MTALVLSAGGMFGAYQAGAWKTLAAQFRPDLVVGASVGALNGWMIAAGCAPDELIAQWCDPSSARLMFRARNLKRRIRMMARRYPLRLPLAVTAVEVPALRLRLFSHVTPRHLLAACAVPGGFPPVRIGGRRYVDGGLLSALPIWAAAELGATRVVALDALPLMPSRVVRCVVRAVRRLAPAPPAYDLEVLRLAPARPLGSLRDAVFWKEGSVRAWIAQGEREARLAAFV